MYVTRQFHHTPGFLTSLLPAVGSLHHGPQSDQRRRQLVSQFIECLLAGCGSHNLSPLGILDGVPWQRKVSGCDIKASLACTD